MRTKTPWDSTSWTSCVWVSDCWIWKVQGQFFVQGTFYVSPFKTAKTRLPLVSSGHANPPNPQRKSFWLLKEKYKQVLDRSGDTSYLSLLEGISSVEEQHFRYDDVTKDSWHAQTLLARCSPKLATLDTRKELGRVNFRKDLWDLYWGQEKNYQ